MAAGVVDRATVLLTPTAEGGCFDLVDGSPAVLAMASHMPAALVTASHMLPILVTDSGRVKKSVGRFEAAF